MAQSRSQRLFERFSDYNRIRKARRVINYMREHSLGRVLIIGAGWEGITESVVGSFANGVVYSDLNPTAKRRPYIAADGRALPFKSDSFHLVFSNAVIEHVGDEADQRRYIDEHRRVGRQCIVSTPNRWFPVESHTLAVFKHWSPKWRAKTVPVFTRLLSKSEFRDLLPPGARIEGKPWSATFLAFFDGTDTGT